MTHPPVRAIALSLISALSCVGPGNLQKARPDAGRPQDDGGAKAPGAPSRVDAAPPAACAEEVRKAEPATLDLLLLIDRSYSMEELVPGTNQSKWILARQALLAFLRDPSSAGLNVGMQIFPWVADNPVCVQDGNCPGSIRDNCLPARACSGPLVVACGAVAGATGPDDCGPGQYCKAGICSLTGRNCTDTTRECGGGPTGDQCQPLPRLCRGYDLACGDAMYLKPIVDFSPLPAMVAPLNQRLLYTPPAGLTPMGPAVAGSLKVLQERLAAQTGSPRRGALLLVTDGLPDKSCVPATASGIADLMAAAQAARPAITTYVVGVFGDADLAVAQPALEEMAMKGGSKAPYIVKTAADFVTAFQAALAEIRGRALPCEFAIPAMSKGPLDYDKVNLKFKGPNGDQDILYVANAQACDPVRGGWYYDADPAMGGMPSRVIVCETTCKQFKAQEMASVDLRYGCQTRRID